MANNELTKELKKRRNEISTGGFEKLQHIPGNLESHAHTKGDVYVQEHVHPQGTFENLNFHLSLTL